MTDAPSQSAAPASPAAPAADAPAQAATSSPAADAPASESATAPTAGQDAANQQPSTTEPATTESPTTDKAEGDKTPDGEKPAAPEKYEFKAPEGVKLDTDLLGELEGFAREKQMSQEDAQKLADMGVKMQQKFASTQAELLTQARAEWVGQSKADAEFGGDKLTENLAVAEKAIATLGTPALAALLKDSGLGNHPEVIRFAFRAGKAISEDRMVVGRVGADPGQRRDAASALYPNQH
jgi:hypothetical protein